MPPQPSGSRCGSRRCSPGSGRGMPVDLTEWSIEPKWDGLAMPRPHRLRHPPPDQPLDRQPHAAIPRTPRPAHEIAKRQLTMAILGLTGCAWCPALVDIEVAAVAARHPLTESVRVTSLLEHVRGTTDTAPAHRCYGDSSASAPALKSERLCLFFDCHTWPERSGGFCLYFPDRRSMTCMRPFAAITAWTRSARPS
jgi:hypothetical protein